MGCSNGINLVWRTIGFFRVIIFIFIICGIIFIFCIITIFIIIIWKIFISMIFLRFFISIIIISNIKGNFYGSNVGKTSKTQFYAENAKKIKAQITN